MLRRRQAAGRPGMSAPPDAPELRSDADPETTLAESRHESEVTALARRRRRRRRLVAVGLLIFISPAVYSYTETMLQPSSLPLGVRSVEWLRSHHGNWLVDEAEHIYYTWKAPKRGGP